MVDGAPPLQALPPVLMTSDPGSFARATIVDRKPQIIRRVVADHAYPTEVVSALDAFAHEIASSVIQPPMASAEDAEARFWRDQWAQYAGRTWLELPWYFAETYFYRRMLEIVGYFDPGRWHAHDPHLAHRNVCRRPKPSIRWGVFGQRSWPKQERRVSWPSSTPRSGATART